MFYGLLLGKWNLESLQICSDFLSRTGSGHKKTFLRKKPLCTLVQGIWMMKLLVWSSAFLDRLFRDGFQKLWTVSTDIRLSSWSCLKSVWNAPRLDTDLVRWELLQSRRWNWRTKLSNPRLSVNFPCASYDSVTIVSQGCKLRLGHDAFLDPNVNGSQETDAAFCQDRKE